MSDYNSHYSKEVKKWDWTCLFQNEEEEEAQFRWTEQQRSCTEHLRNVSLRIYLAKEM